MFQSISSLLLLLIFYSYEIRPGKALSTPTQNSWKDDSFLLKRTKTSFSNNHNFYANYWQNLLVEEHREKVFELKDRRRNWSRQRLEASGISLFHVPAEPDSEIFGEKVVRIYKHGAGDTSSRLEDLFTRGDVLVMTPEMSFGGRSDGSIPKECIVLDVGKNWMTVGIGGTWPNGLWELRRSAGAYLVRLDRTVSDAPLKAQVKALDRLRKGHAGEAASMLANLFKNNSTEHVTLATQSPTHFESENLEDQIFQAMQRATVESKFQPNKSQEEAITWALQRKISLIRGPPGTGKTRVAALLIATALNLKMKNDIDQNIEEQPKIRVLAVTHSNGAADVLLDGLLQMGVPAVRSGRPASVSPKVRHRTIVAISEKIPEVKRLRQEAGKNNLDSNDHASASFEARQYLSDTQEFIAKTALVIVTTCIGARQLMESDDKEMVFPIVVLDEAAQTTEPGLICALAAARANQIILVGDTRQLPPTVTSTKLKDSIGLSPMARMENIRVGQVSLKEQYRMPAALLEHPSKYFYGGQVVCANDDADDILPPRGFSWPSVLPIAFVRTGNDSEITHSFGGKTNPTEVAIVKTIVSRLVTAGEIEAKNIAVISPYSKQVQLLYSELGNSKKTAEVRVGTVDSFQGQETDVVVFSAVRSNHVRELGFLRDSRRLNVAITRSRRGLIIVGDESVLRCCRHWAALLESLKKRRCLMESDDIADEKHVIRVDVTKADRKILADQALDDLLGSDDEFADLF